MCWDFESRIVIPAQALPLGLTPAPCPVRWSNKELVKVVEAIVGAIVKAVVNAAVKVAVKAALKTVAMPLVGPIEPAKPAKVG
jgi:hypothetical protein